MVWTSSIDFKTTTVPWKQAVLVKSLGAAKLSMTQVIIPPTPRSLFYSFTPIATLLTQSIFDSSHSPLTPLHLYDPLILLVIFCVLCLQVVRCIISPSPGPVDLLVWASTHCTSAPSTSTFTLVATSTHPLNTHSQHPLLYFSIIFFWILIYPLNTPTTQYITPINTSHSHIPSTHCLIPLVLFHTINCYRIHLWRGYCVSGCSSYLPTIPTKTRHSIEFPGRYWRGCDCQSTCRHEFHRSRYPSSFICLRRPLTPNPRHPNLTQPTLIHPNPP